MKKHNLVDKSIFFPLLAVALPLLFPGAAHAGTITTTGNKFTMLTGASQLVGRDFDATFSWDGTFNTSVAHAIRNATLTSSNSFLGYRWTENDMYMYGPGTYTVFPACDRAHPGCGSGTPVSFTVAPGQVGVHMIFDWSVGSTNGESVNVWSLNTFTLPWTNNLWWNVGSTNTNGGSSSGSPTAHFGGFNFNSEVGGAHAASPTPVPSAAWLFGSGMLGLMGLGKRKAKARQALRSTAFSG